MDIEAIKNLIAQGEGLHIEFKQSRDSLSRSVFETICAFLNRKGGHIFNIIYIHVFESNQAHSYKGVYFDRKAEMDIKLQTYMQISDLFVRKQSGYTENRIFPYMNMDDFVLEDIDKANYKDTVVSENWTIPNTIGVITPDNVLPRPKNPSIHSLFRQMGWVEDLGSGIRNLYKYCPIYVQGSFPEMEENDIFKLTIRYEKEGSIKSYADKILLLIKENPKITAKEMALNMSVTSRTVERILSDMLKNDIIKRIGSTKGGEWKIKT